MTFLERVESLVYLGPGGSFTEMAKDIFCQKYNLDPYLVPMKSIKKAVEYVDENPYSLAVLPIENSIEGTIRETIDSLIKTQNPNIKVVAELIMPIKHCLLSKTTELYSITGVIAHPQAISQCQNFIHDKLPLHTNIIEVANTAEAAKSLQNYNLTYAAIGTQKTADIYYLNVLLDNINDEQDNKTRFALIGNYNTPKTGKDETSIAFSTENKPGALLDILKIFQDFEINLSYIDSRPSKTNFGEYTFFVDFDGHILDDKIAEALAQIQKHTPYFRLVGSYEKF
ncbi:MAG TPA: prephenate dehydratase [Candidatus Gastranaerophilaceae bacterium]|nr:prephenate dehydratase [Candidatus Gastranaerophilaceae bacterium]HPT41085.1 prephenate dehydratase [Candidatus Gastranaerophilaceae bacterium]